MGQVGPTPEQFDYITGVAIPLWDEGTIPEVFLHDIFVIPLKKCFWRMHEMRKHLFLFCKAFNKFTNFAQSYSQSVGTLYIFKCTSFPIFEFVSYKLQDEGFA